MCREGIDLVTLKVALKHSTDRLEQEVDHLRQWSALASNVNLGDVSARLREALDMVAGGEELVTACVRALAELQVQGPSSTGSGVTITPV
ncbi:MAG: hypothetical protein PHP28_01740 [Actinomycetota bacterium]|nr:hypothetical protein [Actinomycetota bacterium]MDD5667704.1 hypothetical protein [Actinomycetota bacterium]